jgi:two-component sensor histidine kinase
MADLERSEVRCAFSPPTRSETRQQLQDAHNRVISVAAVQQYLHVSGAAGSIDMAPYLTKLCGSLRTSMIADYRSATLKVISDAGTITLNCPGFAGGIVV